MKVKIEAPFGFISNLDTSGFVISGANDVDIIVTDPGSSYKYDRSYLSKFPNLKILATPSTGVTHIDLTDCESMGIKVVNLFQDRAALENIHSSAEFTWMLIMAAYRYFLPAVECVRSKKWRVAEAELRGLEMHGKTIGIIGLGRVGSKIAKFASAFGMNIVYYDPYKDSAYERVSLFDLASRSEIVSINPYLTDETRGFIDRDFFRRCRPGTLVVNTSRGEIVNESDLCDAIERYDIQYATDVVNNEQDLDKFFNSRLYRLFLQHECIITPHIAGATIESQCKAMHAMFNILRNMSV